MKILIKITKNTITQNNIQTHTSIYTIKFTVAKDIIKINVLMRLNNFTEQDK